MAGRKPRKAGNPQWYAWIRSICGLQSRISDTMPGAQRVSAGGNTLGLWDYAPSIPAFPIGPNVRCFVWTFDAPQDALTDAVDANAYRWNETASGSGTPLAVTDVVGGGAIFTNGASDDNYYFYESGAEIAQLVATYDVWFEIILQVSDATQSDLFAGLCARLASGNLFDNRVDCVGFRKDDGDTNIDLETDITGETATSSAAQGTLADATDISLGFHYNGKDERVYFFIDDAYVNSIATTLPTTELCVAFGLRNGEGVAKVMVVKAIKLMVEVPK
jgi:hypothetical protein